MRRPPRKIPRLYFQWASITEEGMTLELIEADESGEMVEGCLCPAATIVADDDETQWIEVYPEEGPVRIPLSELMKTIELAREECTVRVTTMASLTVHRRTPNGKTFILRAFANRDLKSSRLAGGAIS